LSYKDPVMVSSTSNVGTKLKIAEKVKSLKTVGIDLVALCVNDVVAQGAEPIVFHNHFSTPKLDVQEALHVVEGIAQGCKEAGCALLDATTAELPGVFTRNGCNMVGFAVGMVERNGLLPRTTSMKSGDVLIGLPSAGLHSNGFALARSIIRTAGWQYESPAPFNPTCSLGEALLSPSRIYAKAVLALSKADLLVGAVHITGGGLKGSLLSFLPEALAAHLSADSWELPTVIRWLAAVGKIRTREMATTFNCGLGMVLVVAKDNMERAMKLLREHQEEPVVVGELVNRAFGKDAVELEGAECSWLMLPELGVSLPFPEVLSSLQAPRAGVRTRTVIVGGRQELTVMRSLVQLMSSPACACELVAAVSTDPSSKVLVHAEAAGLPAYSLAEDAVAFSEGLQRVMEESGAQQILLLSDSKRSLFTRQFLESRLGRVVLVHDSLLPAFPDCSPIEAALAAGVCITGCTVCFALPSSSGSTGVEYGPIIMQESTPVLPGDDLGSLQDRIVMESELKLIPAAMQLVAEGSVVLSKRGGLKRSASFIKDSGDEMEYTNTLPNGEKGNSSYTIKLTDSGAGF